jgi:electron transport complex protein RnfB
MKRPTADCYETLADHLDSLPGGFPRTESGVELRILQHLFTPEEAQVASQLILLPENASVIARRVALPLSETERVLGSLSKKRLISCFSHSGRMQYMAQQFVIGFWEGQVDRLDKELVEAFEEYFPAFSDSGIWGKAPQLRTIPVHKSIPAQTSVMPYDNAQAIIGAHRFFAVANCICRQEQRLLGRDCGKPEGTCLVFDGAAHYFIQIGRGKRVSKTEVLELLARAEKSGLVLQPGNIENPGNICMCCGCCCGVLRGIKRFPKPAEQVASNFHAHLDSETCTGCGVCIRRCQMDALTLQAGRASLDLDRCIGCGLCVSTCQAGALSLVKKEGKSVAKASHNDIALAIRLGQARGRLGWGAILRLLMKSGWDRITVFFKPPR